MHSNVEHHHVFHVCIIRVHADSSAAYEVTQAYGWCMIGGYVGIQPPRISSRLWKCPVWERQEPGLCCPAIAHILVKVFLGFRCMQHRISGNPAAATVGVCAAPHLNPETFFACFLASSLIARCLDKQSILSRRASSSQSHLQMDWSPSDHQYTSDGHL